MNVRRAAAALVIGSLVPLTGAVAAHADSTATAPYRISVHASDSTPASGEQFVVRGTFGTSSSAAVDRPVKVQAFRGGSWHQLTGAVVKTDSEGAYRCRVILSQTGKRVLRVVGVTPKGTRNAFHEFTVTVS